MRNIVGPVIGLVAAVLVGHCNDGCLPTLSPEQAKVAFTAELSDCVVKAKTEAEADSCIAEVKRKWGVCTDAGVVVSCQ